MSFIEEFLAFLRFSSSTSTILLTFNVVLLAFLAIKTKIKVHIILSLYLINIFVVQNFAVWLAFNGINNFFGSHYYFILQLLWMAYFYHEICKLPIQKKSIRYSVIACLIILAIQYSLKPELYFKFNELEVFLCSYLLIIYSLFHFYNILGSSRNYLFFNIGLFVYLLGSTTLFLVVNLHLILNLNKIDSYLNEWIYAVFQLFVLIEGVYQLHTHNIINLKSKLIHGKY